MSIKTAMARHREKSHGDSFTLVSSIPIKDFEDSFLIFRVTDEAVISVLLTVFSNPAYWKAIRRSKKTLLSLD